MNTQTSIIAETSGAPDIKVPTLASAAVLVTLNVSVWGARKQDKESAAELRHAEFKQLEARVMERFEAEAAVRRRGEASNAEIWKSGWCRRSTGRTGARAGT